MPRTAWVVRGAVPGGVFPLSHFNPCVRFPAHGLPVLHNEQPDGVLGKTAASRGPADVVRPVEPLAPAERAFLGQREQYGRGTRRSFRSPVRVYNSSSSTGEWPRLPGLGTAPRLHPAGSPVEHARVSAGVDLGRLDREGVLRPAVQVGHVEPPVQVCLRERPRVLRPQPPDVQPVGEDQGVGARIGPRGCVSPPRSGREAPADPAHRIADRCGVVMIDGAAYVSRWSAP